MSRPDENGAPLQETRRRRSPASGNQRAAGPVFLERDSYRQRRLIDAARLMPVLGLFLFAIPLLWARGGTASSAAVLYVFGIWIVLVVGAALLSRGMRGIDDGQDGTGADGESG